MIVLVTYDLNNPSKNYTPLFEALKLQGPWWHYLKSTWLIDTNKTPTEVWNVIANHVEATDRVFVTNLAPGHQGWLDKDAWAWINARKAP
jgi:hypothetical protein